MHKNQRFNIPLEVLMEAKKCTKHHACLTNDDYRLCGIKLTAGSSARMLCGTGSDCPYSSKLGSQIVCTCPVRHAIHSKYNL